MRTRASEIQKYLVAGAHGEVPTARVTSTMFRKAYPFPILRPHRALALTGL